MEENKTTNSKPKKLLLILSLVLIGMAIIIFMIYEFAPLPKEGIIRFDSFFFYLAVVAYLAGIVMLIVYFVKRIKSGADSGKGKVYVSVLALGCDLLAIFLFIIGMNIWTGLINEVPIMLTGLLLPVAGILLGVYSLSLGKEKLGEIGYAISVFAIIIPVICIVLVILYLSFLALVLAFM